MKYVYVLAIALIAGPLLSYAQSNYKPGFVINSKGDTTKGLINYQEWNNNPDAFLFKPVATRNAEKISPENFKEVNINGFETYQAYTGLITADRTDAAHQSSRDTSFRIATVFLKVLQTGPNVTLYVYTDEIKTRFFIKETATDAKPHELIYRIYYRDNYNTKSENVFIRQLFELASKFNTDGSNSTQIRFDNIEYRQSDLLKVAGAINHIPTTGDKKGNAKRWVNFFAGVGANFTNFRFTSLQTDLHPSNTSVLPLVSAGIDALANPNTGRLIFRLQILVTENKFKADFLNITYPHLPLHYSFSQMSYNAMPQIVYNIYNKENLKIYVSPGVQICDLKYKHESYYSVDGSTITNVTPLLVHTSFFVATSLKAGAKINQHFDISASYQFPAQITSTVTEKINIKSVFAGLNYYFGK